MSNLGIGGWCAVVTTLLAVGFGGEAAVGAAPGKYLVCKKHRDCVFVPSICGRCAPCKPTLRTVGNRKQLQRVRMLQARVRCAKPRCRKCANHKNWLPTRAMCIRNKCTAVPRKKAKPRIHKHQFCKKDTDCVFVPSICRRCAPCKPTMRPVGNRKMLRWVHVSRKKVRCARRRCRRCSRKKNWLGKKAVCFQNRCTVAPLKKKGKPIFSRLKCKRHKDCGLWPAPLCGCLPCGLYWRQAANRRSLRRESIRRSRMGPCGYACRKCARRGLGTRALCIRRRCVVR